MILVFCVFICQENFHKLQCGQSVHKIDWLNEICCNRHSFDTIEPPLSGYCFGMFAVTSN